MSTYRPTLRAQSFGQVKGLLREEGSLPGDWEGCSGGGLQSQQPRHKQNLKTDITILKNPNRKKENGYRKKC